MQYTYCSWLILSSVGLATNDYSQIGQAVSTAQTMAGIAPAAVWALVALASVIGLIKLYIDNKKDTTDLKSIIASSTEAISKNSVILDKLADKIDKCPTNSK